MAQVTVTTGEGPVQTADQAKEILLRFGNMLLDTLQQRKDFVLEQAPLVCQDIVRWGISYNAYCTIIGLILIIFSIWCLWGRKKEDQFSSLKWEDSDNMSKLEVKWLCRGLLGIFTFIVGCAWFSHIEQLIKALWAPRLYIIDYLKEFIK